MLRLCLYLSVILIDRFYEKSIIRVEIEEQRSGLNSQWDETKKSIRDARQKINIQLTQEWTLDTVKHFLTVDHINASLSRIH